ncbi:MAG: hypothetical protein GWO44_15875, partial [Thermoplasmata archaeon]|nr:hypothetical protein [Thermoplasmata archaeon]NIY04684.1 hypothetical protein [Thermoplasmata archaeon]
MTRWVGWTIPLQAYGAWVCPTYHPAYLLRMDGDELLTNITNQHLETALELEREPVTGLTLSELEQEVEV